MYTVWLHLGYLITFLKLQTCLNTVVLGYNIDPHSARFRHIYISGAQINIKHRRYSLSPVATKSISCDLL